MWINCGARCEMGTRFSDIIDGRQRLVDGAATPYVLHVEVVQFTYWMQYIHILIPSSDDSQLDSASSHDTAELYTVMKNKTDGTAVQSVYYFSTTALGVKSGVAEAASFLLTTHCWRAVNH